MIKVVASKVVIDDWQERKKLNNSLPPDQRKPVEATIDDLQLPMFRGDAIGALHEATEAFAVCKYLNI